MIQDPPRPVEAGPRRRARPHATRRRRGRLHVALARLRAEARWRRRRGAWAGPDAVRVRAVALVAVLTAVAGWVIGADVLAPDPPRSSEPVVARGAGLQVTAPASWRRIPAEQAAAPAPFRRPLVLERGDDRLLAELLAVESRTLLPDELTGAEARSVRVIPVGDARALRYDGVGPDGVTVLVLPTTRGVATIACETARGAAMRACVSTAATVRVRQGRPLALGRDTAFRVVLARVVRDLRAARLTGRRSLAAASDRAARARAARAIAADLKTPVARLAGLAASPAATAVVDALRETAAAYSAFGAAVDARDADRHRRAAARIVAQERAVDRAVRAIAEPAP